MVFDAIPDIIVLDIMMPSMDGYTVCEKLKEQDHTKDIPIIILSAKTDWKDKLKAMEIGIDDYIVKPFNPLELKALIKMDLKPIFQS
jgi:two-component system alkaline phosphatase synthesis response regulator PhoP